MNLLSCDCLLNYLLGQSVVGVQTCIFSDDRFCTCKGPLHSDLSVKKGGKQIPANQRLYVNEAKSGSSEGATLIGRSGLVCARVLAATGYVCAMYPE